VYCEDCQRENEKCAKGSGAVPGLVEELSRQVIGLQADVRGMNDRINRLEEWRRSQHA
jgi:hypothetical protein